MPRIPRTGTLAPLRLAPAPWIPPTRSCFAASRTVSTTSAARADSWLRNKLWKGPAPGTADPYTERPASESISHLPDEALEPQPQPRTVKTAPTAPKQTRLALPPRRTEAVVEKEVKAKDPTYVPAIDIGGLEEIPPLKKWWDLPGHWGKESKFRGFGPSERVTAGALIEVYLRVAVVETLVLKHTGELQTSKSPSALRRALAIDIRVESGKLWLEGDIDSLSRKPNQEDDRPSGEDMATSPPPKKVSLEEAMQLTKTWGQAWKNIILDEQFKFAVRKRLYQLTGVHIPDSRLGASTTVQDLLVFAIQDPKPPKLAEALHRQRNLQRLRNVTVHRRRVGPIDKEKDIGRWKVIQEELRKRDLPARGTKGLSGNRERDWLTGKL